MCLPKRNTLNINGINSLIKRHKVAEYFVLNQTQLHVVYKKCTSGLRTHTQKVMRWKKRFHANGK